MDKLRSLLVDVDQTHVVKFYDELPTEQKSQLESDISEVDWRNLHEIYTSQVQPQTENGKIKPTSKIDDRTLEELPPGNIEGTTRCSTKTLESYRNIGLTCIGQGRVAALVLAGGQGTRLGVNYPKGMYDIGLPSHKSLFQLQAERILELSKLSGGTQILWYVMTSGATIEMTRSFFEESKYFGLDPANVIFFEQNNIPCMDFDGKVLLDQRHRIARSPNGNGGLYEALHKNGILDHMRSKGVEHVHVYCVDNVLVRVCDPTFIGYCVSRQVDAGAKVVEKVSPSEAVGIICKVNNRFKVIEYSEISDSISNKRVAKTGKLAFNAGNICEHFFKVDFLENLTGDKRLKYHVAVKKIPHISLETGERVAPSEPNGIKLEKFIFDVFEFSDKFAVWEVIREDEFSPLKNSNDVERNNPTTALRSLERAYSLKILNV